MQEYNNVWGPSVGYSFSVRNGFVSGPTVTINYLRHRLKTGDVVNLSGFINAIGTTIIVISPNVFTVNIPGAPPFPSLVGGDDPPLVITCFGYSQTMKYPKIVRTTIPTGTTIEIQTLENDEWETQKVLAGTSTLIELDFLYLWEEVRLARTVGSNTPITNAFYRTADLSSEPTPSAIYEIPEEATGGGGLIEVGTPGTYGVVTTNEYGQVIAGTPDSGGGDSNVYITVTNGTGSTIPKFSPVRFSGSSVVALAQANSTAYKVIGLTTEAISPSSTGQVLVEGTLTGTTGEWNTVTGGTGLLTDGSTYFLNFSTPGILSSTVNVDTAPAGSYLVPVGIALSTTQFKLEIDSPVKL